jgi:hypothetical protein
MKNVIVSTRSWLSSRPRAAAASSVVACTFDAISTCVARPSAGTSTSSRTGSTWWPSDSQSFAASSAASRHSGWVGAPLKVSVCTAMRSRPGAVVTSARYGRSGSGA